MKLMFYCIKAAGDLIEEDLPVKILLGDFLVLCHETKKQTTFRW